MITEEQKRILSIAIKLEEELLEAHALIEEYKGELALQSRALESERAEREALQVLCMNGDWTVESLTSELKTAWSKAAIFEEKYLRLLTETSLAIPDEQLPRLIGS